MEDKPLNQIAERSNESIVIASDDKMFAELDLGTPEEGKTYEVEDIIAILNAKGVKQGIKREVLEEMLEKEQYFERRVVAEGKEPINGEDGYFEFFFRTEMPSIPRILEDDTVDYLNMELFEAVKKEQKLVEYHPATIGQYGYTVDGKLMMPKRGKDKPTLRGKGFVLSKDKKIYTSLLDGKITYSNGKMEIVNVHTVDGDLDVKTGNVHFNGDVFIHGNVISGMTIQASGDVVVDGHVESAQIYAGKDIMLKQGVQGKGKGEIAAGGKIYGKFFENTTIRAGSDLECNYLLNSKVNIKGSVIVNSQRGVIIGGKITALGGVKATTLGNEAEILTEFDVGITTEQIKELSECTKDIQKVESEISIFDRGIQSFAVAVANQHKINQATYQKVLQARKMKKDELEELTEKKRVLAENMEQYANSVVTVSEIAHPGVTVTIDNRSVTVDIPMRNVTFRKRGDKIAVYENF